MRIVTGAGWTRRQAQEYLFAHACRSVGGMKAVGKFRDSEYEKQHREGGAHPLAEAGKFHRGAGPDEIEALAAANEQVLPVLTASGSS